jgi:hypothetical protein
MVLATIARIAVMLSAFVIGAIPRRRRYGFAAFILMLVVIASVTAVVATIA